MIPIRSASASASSRYWVVRNTVMLSSWASRATSSQRAARLWTSSPVVGSSRTGSGASGPEPRRDQAALHSPRIAADPAVSRLGLPDPLEQLLNATPAVRARQALQGGLKEQMFASGEDRVERRLLERGSDHRPHLRALTHEVVAAHAGAAAGRGQQRGQHQDGGRLSRAVRAEKAVDFARRDRQVDAIDRARSLTELADEVVHLGLGNLVLACRSPHGDQLVNATTV
jgi:hypothetical protein